MIIPVYRGFEETKRCLDSVLANKDDLQAEIIVIDDCSPDPLIREMADALSAASRITLLRNTTNLGFVASVNMGMAKAGPRDVVLLNSDTEVPPGWLQRLAGHAYSGRRVGTVTPFSNQAAICSWPTNNGSAGFEDFSTRQIDEAFREANCARQVAIPTAVGFCMYIRGDCLNKIGTFDVQTFGRGYGEENDFCLRATKAGWRHLLACDMFVFHRGETSFGPAAQERNHAMRALTARYPGYLAAVARHIEAREVDPSRFAAAAALLRKSTKPVILLISHELGGGTERHVRELVQTIGNQAHFVLLQPRGPMLQFSMPQIDGLKPAVVAVENLEQIRLLVLSFGVKRIHVHHWLGLKIPLRKLLVALGLPFDITTHDYTTICPQIDLLRQPQGVFCGEPAEAVCNACIAANPRNGADDIGSWRNRYLWLLNEAERVICPSEDARKRLSRYAPQANLITIPHEPRDAPEWTVKTTALSPNEPMRIGLIGGISPNKGLNALIQFLNEASPSSWEVIVVGWCHPPLPEPLRKSVQETGPYKEEELLDLLRSQQLHAAWFPAPCPETYSYTLSSAISIELPIVASDLGAFPERLEGRPFTWLAPVSRGEADWNAIFHEVRRSLLRSGRVTTSRDRATDSPFYPARYLAPMLHSSEHHVGGTTLGNDANPHHPTDQHAKVRLNKVK